MDPVLWRHSVRPDFVGPLPAYGYGELNELLTAADYATAGGYSDGLLASSASGGGAGGGSGGAPARAAGAPGVLFLDFDGARVYSRTGDFWLGSSFVDVPGYNLAAFGWGGRERESVDAIRQFVAEDYAAYNVLVTTAAPAGGEYTTIYVGGGNDWFRPGSGVIGVATYDPGNRDASNYGFAFAEELGLYRGYCGADLLGFSEYLANLIAHEAAHTFGADHVSDVTELMNPYLPIAPRRMMFGQGTVPGASRVQDTQSLLGTNLGYLDGPDDCANTAAGAQRVSPNGTIGGLLERRDDVDAFVFTVPTDGTGGVSVKAPVFGNLDARLEAYRKSDGSLMVRGGEGGGEWDAYGAFPVRAGEQYVVEVSSAAGGSSGRYTVEVTVSQGAPAPLLRVTDGMEPGEDRQMDFGAVMVGGARSGTVQIANAGTAELVVGQLTATGPFTLSLGSQAGVSGDDIRIAPGGVETVVVTFGPGQAGPQTGTVTIGSNDAAAPAVTLFLAGQGQTAQADIAAPATVDFGEVQRGTIGQAGATIRNEGQDRLIISKIAVTAPFVWEGSGGELSVEAGRSVMLPVALEAGQRGRVEGQMRVFTNDPDESVVTVALTAQVCGGALAVEESAQAPDDGQVDFGAVRVGETGQQTITLRNTGDGPLTITSVSLAGPFFLRSSDQFGEGGLVLPAGQAAGLEAAFTPVGLGSATGRLMIASDDPDLPTATVQLAAAGVGGILEVHEADGADDGQVSGGSFAAGQGQTFDAWEMSNHGTAPLTVQLALAWGEDFELGGPAAVTLAPGEAYTVRVQIDSQTARRVSDVLSLTADDVGGTTAEVGLVGDGHAVIGAGQRYQFLDQTGDRVTVSLTGEARAMVVLGAAGEADIASIEVLGATGREALRIWVAGEGRTRVGRIAGGRLRAIEAPGVDLLGGSVELAGLERLRRGAVLGGSEIGFAAEGGAAVQVGAIGGESRITVAGRLDSFGSGDFVSGRVSSEAAGRVRVRGVLAGELAVGGDLERVAVGGDLTGAVHVTGSIGTVQIAEGDLTGWVAAGADIGRLLALHGRLGGAVRAGDEIDRIVAEDGRGADIRAGQRIGRLVARGNWEDCLVAVAAEAQSQQGQSAWATEAGAALEVLRVGGTFSGSTVAVGVAPDGTGCFLNGRPSATAGAIGQVVINEVDTDNQHDPFGLVARDGIGRLTVSRQMLPPQGYQQGDFVVAVLGSSAAGER